MLCKASSPILQDSSVCSKDSGALAAGMLPARVFRRPGLALCLPHMWPTNLSDNACENGAEAAVQEGPEGAGQSNSSKQARQGLEAEEG